MESNNQNQSQPIKLTRTEPATAGARSAPADAQLVADKVSEAARAVREHVEERGAEVLNQAKQQVNTAYEQANKRVSEQYAKAVDYSHENPGITTLIALGVGVGIGLLLAGSVSAVRSRE